MSARAGEQRSIPDDGNRMGDGGGSGLARDHDGQNCSSSRTSTQPWAGSLFAHSRAASMPGRSMMDKAGICRLPSANGRGSTASPIARPAIAVRTRRAPAEARVSAPLRTCETHQGQGKVRVRTPLMGQRQGTILKKCTCAPARIAAATRVCATVLGRWPPARAELHGRAAKASAAPARGRPAARQDA